MQTTATTTTGKRMIMAGRIEAPITEGDILSQHMELIRRANAQLQRQIDLMHECIHASDAAIAVQAESIEDVFSRLKRLNDIIEANRNPGKTH